ncbi:MAG TPA: cytochrome c biogenesis protein CcdA [Cytophagaceae bacterium]|nr:cytochrome c biogenesis protein CcdA [Cytophagaceae bacterium]
MKKILIILLAILFSGTLAFADKKVKVPKEELEQTSRNIQNLLKRDSLNNLIIQELKKKLEEKKTDTSSTTITTQTPLSTSSVGETPATAPEDTSLWLYLLLAMSSGLIALLTPCVYPMVPMTVSLFTKRSEHRSHAVFKAFIYGLSIVVIYSLLGLIPATIYGVEYANLLSTHWLTNIIFFVVFVVFGVSFLGMFEITLPASFVNRVDAQADRGGYAGIFFMAFTLVLVSFSCTAPFVGTILIEAQGGLAIKPVLGMLAYSITFAAPFTIFAMFPSLLKSLPKSGGWLNEIKVTLGFIELALALKFLSVADLVYHWGILDREIFIAIWIVLSVLLGIYWLGKINFSHDSSERKTTVARLLISIVPFVFAVYMFPGMFGAPLKALSGLLPPMDRHDFDLPSMIAGRQGTEGTKENKLCDKPRYSEILHLPHGLQGYFDYRQAIACAKEKNLPVFIDFTGHGCANCRRMEANVWSEEKVFSILNNDYVLVALYVDERTELPESEWITGADGSLKKTIGKVNHDLEISRYHNAAQPFYVLLNPYTEQPLVKDIIGSEPNVEKFVQYLEQGKTAFKEYKP